MKEKLVRETKNRTTKKIEAPNPLSSWDGTPSVDENRQGMEPLRKYLGNSITST